jgi:Raf kinase inhibitor-like YbhB/YbcL family protein
MKITSEAFKEGEKIPSKYTCEGLNWNPALTFEGVPKGAKSLILIVDDLDVPKSLRADGRWVHWLLYDIPPETAGIAEHAAPPGTAGKGTSGRVAYMGPCPPDREHRYFFRLFAMDALFDWPKGLHSDEVEQKMASHLLEKAELMGRYELQKKQRP